MPCLPRSKAASVHLREDRLRDARQRRGVVDASRLATVDLLEGTSVRATPCGAAHVRRKRLIAAVLPSRQDLRGTSLPLGASQARQILALLVRAESRRR